MSWLLLIGAIITEVLATTSMKMSEGFTRLWPSIGMVVGYVVALGLLTLTLRTLEVSTAYAMWSGLGTALVAVIGVFAFGETMDWTKLVGLALIIAGVMLLNLAGAH
ncbi:small multidrug resistance pump [Haloactinospora alba]|uniref:Small multidrug resistance pump n=1 Tax=Haloactinospora alba TaxID=405555 RepID=A0A543N8Z3_9ACTN|nr:multidrug efflux SMR transporter [Haloactinospora alba]TQN28304.1 small multidrug resistance pump [Haloactinospora alba]